MISLDSLREQYTYMVYKVLPEQALKEKWPVYADHCIARLVLDYVFLDDHRKHINPPAYINLNKAQLERAVTVTLKMQKNGKHFVELMQYASLKFRGHIRTL